MNKIVIFCAAGWLFLSSVAAAQVPTPVINNEMRDNSSIRSRTIEMERVKREADKPKTGESTEEREIKFSEIKEDFENIQKLQILIVKTYTTGEKINYAKISQSAAEMTKKAVRLDLNLFYSKSDPTDKVIKNDKQKTVKDLIVELDKIIGVFIGSPIFKNIKLVDSETSEKSRLDLEKILKLSVALSKESKKMR